MLEDRIISISEVAAKIVLWTVLVSVLEYFAFDRSVFDIFTRVYWLAGGAFGIYITAHRRAVG